MEWYVYRLSYKGVIFYIGLTGNVFNRYKEHYCGNVLQTSALINFIRRVNNDHIDIDILHIVSCRYTAFGLERANIRMYANQQYPICNDKENDFDNILRFARVPDWSKLKRANYTNINNIISSKINEYKSNKYARLGNTAIIS